MKQFVRATRKAKEIMRKSNMDKRYWKVKEEGTDKIVFYNTVTKEEREYIK